VLLKFIQCPEAYGHRKRSGLPKSFLLKASKQLANQKAQMNSISNWRAAAQTK
jgi:hypothetical protein